jgi:hypothetical protein
MSGVAWRRLGERVAMVATAAAVISMVVLVVVALVGRGGGGVTAFNGGGGVAAFNGCIHHTRFLALMRHGSGSGVIETIEDRAHGTVQGEVASGRAPTILGGAAAANGPYVMSTATPLGRDASAIEGCWDRFFPIAPGA